MGQFFCEHHGMQSPSYTSPLIAKKVIDGLSLKGLQIINLVLHLPYTSKKGVFKVDQQFMDEFDISSDVFDEALAFEVYSELKPVCSECLKALIES
ncbi:MAG: hypothetical protein D6160_17545 [Ketobacter sp.]|nr:MAG: hypothetical protein D6160_17545 [Ketobacter sp.]